MTRAVVFDLFETLVDYDDSRSREFSAQVAQLCGREPEEFHDVWIEGRPARETGPMAPYLASLGLDEQATREFIERRRAFSREILARPREGAVETLRELRARGLHVGLITVCSGDAVDVWPETSSRAKRCSSVTAPTTSSPAPSESACARSSCIVPAKRRPGRRCGTGTARGSRRSRTSSRSSSSAPRAPSKRTRPGARHAAMSRKQVSRLGQAQPASSLSTSDRSRCLAPGRGAFGQVCERR